MIPEIVEQHAAEAAFLWCLRDAATDQPHLRLRNLADLEQRVEAHLDGLRVAGDAGVEIARAQVERQPGMGELFTLATLELEHRDELGLERILTVAEQVPESRRGLFGAVGWVAPRTLRGGAMAWLDSPVSFRRLLGVVACSLHRADPGSRMHDLLQDEPLVRARALRLAGELRRVDLNPRIHPELTTEDDTCRFWAAWSAALLGNRILAIPVLQAFALADGPFKWRALDLVIRAMDKPSVVAWLRALGNDPANARLIVVAAGVHGDPVVVPWLIDKMRVAPLARIAGESFSMISGVDLVEQDMWCQAPQESPPRPSDDPLDENVAMDADEQLPWPDPDKVEAWWQKNERRFAQDTRYLVGHPLSQASGDQVLQTGYQRQRRAAAYELALSDPGAHLWNWRARSYRQVRLLPAARRPPG
jgi:uncharacterized protein (TIGR02270 family)